MEMEEDPRLPDPRTRSWHVGTCAVSLPPWGLAATGVDVDPDILTLSLRLPPRTPALALMSFKTLRVLCAQLSLPPSPVLVHRALGSAPIELLCARGLYVCARTHTTSRRGWHPTAPLVSSLVSPGPLEAPGDLPSPNSPAG